MNTDIRLAVDWPDHPKTRALIRRCGAAGALGLVRLWVWSACNRPDGDLSDLTDREIEAIARWEGAAGELIAALRAAVPPRGAWIDAAGWLHDWTDHNGYAAASQKRSAQARENALKRWHGKAKKRAERDKSSNKRPHKRPHKRPDDAPAPAPSPARTYRRRRINNPSSLGGDADIASPGSADADAARQETTDTLTKPNGRLRTDAEALRSCHKALQTWRRMAESRGARRPLEIVVRELRPLGVDGHGAPKFGARPNDAETLIDFWTRQFGQEFAEIVRGQIEIERA